MINTVGVLELYVIFMYTSTISLKHKIPEIDKIRNISQANHSKDLH